MTGPSLDALLALLVLAAAFGLDLYAAAAAAGIAAALGLIALPLPLGGLAAPHVSGSLLALLAIQTAVTRFRVPDLAWNALHTGVRPFAAALAVGAALPAASPAPQWAAALAGLALGTLTHLSIFGARVAARTAVSRPSPGLLTAGQTLLAAVLAPLAFLTPQNAAALAALVVLLPLPWARPLWGAARLACTSLVAPLRPASRPRSWDPGIAALSPTWAAVALDALGEPASALRSAIATLARLDGRWLFRRGRLVLGTRRLLFLAGRGPSALELDPIDRGSDGAAVIETVAVGREPAALICVGPDGPPGTVILADLKGEGPGHGT